MFPRFVHGELHARGFVDAIEEHLFPNGGFVPTNPRKFAAFIKNDIRVRPEFADLFQFGTPATQDYATYRSGLRRIGLALGAFGLLASIATISASAETIGCEMK